MSLKTLNFGQKLDLLVPVIQANLRPLTVSAADVRNMLMSQRDSAIDQMLEKEEVPIPTTIHDMGELLADMMMGELLKIVDHPVEMISGNTSNETIERDTIQYLAEQYPTDLSIVQQIDLDLRTAILNHMKRVLTLPEQT